MYKELCLLNDLLREYGIAEIEVEKLTSELMQSWKKDEYSDFRRTVINRLVRASRNRIPRISNPEIFLQTIGKSIKDENKPLWAVGFIQLGRTYHPTKGDEISFDMKWSSDVREISIQRMVYDKEYCEQFVNAGDELGFWDKKNWEKAVVTLGKMKRMENILYQLEISIKESKEVVIFNDKIEQHIESMFVYSTTQTFWKKFKQKFI